MVFLLHDLHCKCEIEIQQNVTVTATITINSFLLDDHQTHTEVSYVFKTKYFVFNVLNYFIPLTPKQFTYNSLLITKLSL